MELNFDSNTTASERKRYCEKKYMEYITHMFVYHYERQ